MRSKLYVENYSCMNRSDDYNNVVSSFTSNGFELVDELEIADYALVFTCGSTSAFIKRSHMAISRIRSHLRDDHIIVCGCSTVTDPVFFEDTEYIISSPTNFDAIKQTFGFCLEEHLNVPTNDRNNNGRNCIIVQKGCIRKCSYCAIWKAVGDIHSKSIDTVIEIVQKCIDEGVYDLSITGDCVGDYGIDINSNIVKLLDAICSLSDKITINIYDLHPQTIIEYYDVFLRLAGAGRINTLGIPLQSGSNKILKLMRRDFNKEKMIDILLSFKHCNVNLSTDIIIGFPGETDKDFDETIDLLKAVNFDHISVNVYSDLEGTASSQMDNKVGIKDIVNRFSNMKKENIRGIDEAYFEFQVMKIIGRD